MNTESTSTTAVSTSTHAPLLVRIGLELVVIFIGVYAAFALSEYESRRDASTRRHLLQSALVREIHQANEAMVVVNLLQP